MGLISKYTYGMGYVVPRESFEEGQQESEGNSIPRETEQHGLQTYCNYNG